MMGDSVAPSPPAFLSSSYPVMDREETELLINYVKQAKELFRLQEDGEAELSRLSFPASESRHDSKQSGIPSPQERQGPSLKNRANKAAEGICSLVLQKFPFSSSVFPCVHLDSSLRAEGRVIDGETTQSTREKAELPQRVNQALWISEFERLGGLTALYTLLQLSYFGDEKEGGAQSLPLLSLFNLRQMAFSVVSLLQFVDSMSAESAWTVTEQLHVSGFGLLQRVSQYYEEREKRTERDYQIDERKLSVRVRTGTLSQTDQPEEGRAVEEDEEDGGWTQDVGILELWLRLVGKTSLLSSSGPTLLSSSPFLACGGTASHWILFLRCSLGRVVRASFDALSSDLWVELMQQILQMALPPKETEESQFPLDHHQFFFYDGKGKKRDKAKKMLELCPCVEMLIGRPVEEALQQGEPRSGKTRLSPQRTNTLSKLASRSLSVSEEEGTVYRRLMDLYSGLMDDTRFSSLLAEGSAEQTEDFHGLEQHGDGEKEDVLTLEGILGNSLLHDTVGNLTTPMNDLVVTGERLSPCAEEDKRNILEANAFTTNPSILALLSAEELPERLERIYLVLLKLEQLARCVVKYLKQHYGPDSTENERETFQHQKLIARFFNRASQVTQLHDKLLSVLMAHGFDLERKTELVPLFSQSSEREEWTQICRNFLERPIPLSDPTYDVVQSIISTLQLRSWLPYDPALDDPLLSSLLPLKEWEGELGPLGIDIGCLTDALCALIPRKTGIRERILLDSSLLSHLLRHVRQSLNEVRAVGHYKRSSDAELLGERLSPLLFLARSPRFYPYLENQRALLQRLLEEIVTMGITFRRRIIERAPTSSRKEFAERDDLLDSLDNEILCPALEILLRLFHWEGTLLPGFVLEDPVLTFISLCSPTAEALLDYLTEANRELPATLLHRIGTFFSGKDPMSHCVDGRLESLDYLFREIIEFCAKALKDLEEGENVMQEEETLPSSGEKEQRDRRGREDVLLQQIESSLHWREEIRRSLFVQSLLYLEAVSVWKLEPKAAWSLVARYSSRIDAAGDEATAVQPRCRGEKEGPPVWWNLHDIHQKLLSQTRRTSRSPLVQYDRSEWVQYWELEREQSLEETQSLPPVVWKARSLPRLPFESSRFLASRRAARYPDLPLTVFSKERVGNWNTGKLPQLNLHGEEEYYYFEVKVQATPKAEEENEEEDYLWLASIGFAEAIFSEAEVPGANDTFRWSVHDVFNIGYFSDGNINTSLREEKTIIFYSPEAYYTEGDTVGAGIDLNARTFFFTKNGKVVFPPTAESLVGLKRKRDAEEPEEPLPVFFHPSCKVEWLHGAVGTEGPVDLIISGMDAEGKGPWADPSSCPQARNSSEERADDMDVDGDGSGRDQGKAEVDETDDDATHYHLNHPRTEWFPHLQQSEIDNWTYPDVHIEKLERENRSILYVASDFLPPQLTLSLQTDMNQLGAGYSATLRKALRLEKEIYKGQKVVNLLDPFLSPYIEGVSLPSDPAKVCQRWARGNGRRWRKPWSPYQLLPSAFSVSSEGETTILSDLSPWAPKDHYPSLYSDVEKLFSSLLPLFERCCADRQGEGGETLRGKELQVIVRSAEYPLSPSQDSEGDDWIATGVPQEDILAIGIFFFSLPRGLRFEGLAFRQTVDADNLLPQPPALTEQITPFPYYAEHSTIIHRNAYFFADGSPTRAADHMVDNNRRFVGSCELETVPVTEGTAVVFRNNIQHRFLKITADSEAAPSSPLSVKALTFMLVCPRHPLPSSLEVPPSMNRPWEMSLFFIMVALEDAARSCSPPLQLSVELLLKIASFLSPLSSELTIEKVLEHRARFDKERKLLSLADHQYAELTPDGWLDWREWMLEAYRLPSY